jgi:NADPH-dependent 2,4-dienoyl-CoA reductase/sulfur reductase-like enzyme
VAASSWIAPPPPAPEAAIADSLAAVRAAVDVPLVATTRVVDLRAAERLIESGAADAVGMTRALIADPELVEKAATGRRADVLACIGCNQGCIGHYHAGVPIGCLVNPRTGRERTLPRRSGPARPLRVVVVGAGPAGVAAAVEAAGHGDSVLLLDRASEVGGQLRLAGRAPAHGELWRRWRSNATRQLAHPRIELRLGREVSRAELAGADVVVLATGARPFVPGWAGDSAVDAWSAIANPAAVAGPVLVADWGGGWEGLDAAEVLARHGLDVMLACAAPCPGQTLHQYQRNLYLARLDEEGVAILHHTEVTAKSLRHLFSGRTSRLPDVATTVHAQGREPEDELWSALEGAPGRVRAGDVLGPRSAEEATLEGVTALQAARAAVS